MKLFWDTLYRHMNQKMIVQDRSDYRDAIVKLGSLISHTEWYRISESNSKSHRESQKGTKADSKIQKYNSLTI